MFPSEHKFRYKYKRTYIISLFFCFSNTRKDDYPCSKYNVQYIVQADIYIKTQTRSVWSSRLDCKLRTTSCHQMNSDQSPKISMIVLPIIWINFVNVKFFLTLLLIFLSQFSTSNKLVLYNQKTGMH